MSKFLIIKDYLVPAILFEALITEITKDRSVKIANMFLEKSKGAIVHAFVNHFSQI